MVGATIVELLQDRYYFQNLSLEVGVDITDPKAVDSYVRESEAEWVIHLAAKTQVDEAETERSLGEESPTWKVNVGATKILVDTCRNYSKKLLYISTDFVFPGGNQIFNETDTPQPIGWYAETKYLGEEAVKTLGNDGLIVRIAFPYGAVDGPKKDFVAKFRQLFSDNQSITAPTDQIITPTYIPDIAAAIDLLIQQNQQGIVHVVGSQSLSSYQAALSVAESFGFSTNLVQPTTAAEYYQHKAKRATELRISNQKLCQLGVTPLTFVEGITRLKAEAK
jgi:dTDP-4-dehydrorhamnose reductase